MAKLVSSCLLLFALLIVSSSKARSIISTNPQQLRSFNIKTNQVYAPRLDDPSSRKFEKCSTDTFQMKGPCTYEICYLYLLRTGSDGWKPESVKINGPNTKGVTFKYNTFLPSGVWYGFNHCDRETASAIM